MNPLTRFDVIELGDINPHYLIFHDLIRGFPMMDCDNLIPTLNTIIQLLLAQILGNILLPVESDMYLLDDDHQIWLVHQ